ncbi:MAG: hypothetical protein DME18_01515 [Verrucomicrobia bacterium]|nr:MAG: hypothetical protein DME18_01515 [Verrucomicrobiota bacterium]
MSKLILSGVGGRLHAGEAWSIWTFEDQLHTNVFPAQLWDPRRREEAANHAYRFLRDQRPKKNNGHLDKALAAIGGEASLSGTLTVFLFTDGTEPIKGTPFDEPINAIFTTHAAGMRKAKKPFVTVFVAQNAQIAAYSVTPGGEPIFIPRLAKTSEKESAAPPPEPSSATKPEATSAPQPPTKKSLTVDEISEALRQSRKAKTNTVAAAPAPLILRGPTARNDSSIPGEPTQHNAEFPAPTPNASPPASDKTAPPNRSASVSNAAPEIAPVPAVRNEPGAPAGKSASAPAATNALSAPPKDVGPVTSPKPTGDETGMTSAAPSASPQTAAILQPEPASNAWKYLAAAGALLLVGITLAWLYNLAFDGKGEEVSPGFHFAGASLFPRVVVKFTRFA